LWFQKKKWKCEIPIGSNVKLSRVMAAILNFRSANDSQVKYRTTQWLFLQSHNSIDLVVSNKKIFKISTNQNTLWALAAMLGFRLAPKNKNLAYDHPMYILPSLLQICFVVSEKKMKMWNSHRVQCKSSHGGQLEFPIVKRFTNLVQDHPMIIPAKSQFNWLSGF
jgi:hypothetical protein